MLHFWDENLEGGSEGREVHIGQAYTSININLLLGCEIVELSSCIFQK